MEKISKEKLIEALECCIDDETDCRDCPLWGVPEGSVLVQCKATKLAIDYIKSQPEVIFCKDCEHFHNDYCSLHYFSNHDEEINFNKFFCADGVRRRNIKVRKKPVEVQAYKTHEPMDIVTLEGIMHADVGDWIITGVNGEKYPCKPDVFEKTYERIDE